MKPMRRKEREVTDLAEICGILERCKVCRLAMRDEDELYLIPMNYGYCFANGTLRLYFHCAKEGRKLDVLRQNPNVAFEMDAMLGLTEGATACEYGCTYESVTGTACAALVEENREKCEALSLLMKHQTGKTFAFTPKEADAVCVLRLEATNFSAKRL